VIADQGSPAEALLVLDAKEVSTRLACPVAKRG